MRRLFFPSAFILIGVASYGSFAPSAQAVGVVQLGTSTYSVNEGQTNLVIGVVRAGDPSGEAAVDVGLTDGTAMAGVNYTSVTQTLHFGDGQTSASFNIPILDDGVAGESKTFNIVLSNPSNCTLGRSQAVVTIVDTDLGLSFSTNHYRIVEANTNALITILRLGRTNETVSVNFGTVAGTAQPGSIYQNTNSLLTFAPGQTTLDVNVPVLDNSVADGDVTVNLILSNPSSGARLQEPSTAVLTILDNDLHRVTSLDESALRSAINAGGPVVVDCDGVVYLTRPIDVSRNVSIDASGHNFTISGSNTTRVLSVRAGVRFAMTNVTVADGCEQALYNAGNSTLINCTFKNNWIHRTMVGGGAIYQAAGAQLDLFGCSFMSNVATIGSAIAMDMASGPTTMTNCTFVGNTGYGEGAMPFCGNGTVAILGDSLKGRKGGPLTVVNCTFAQNFYGAFWWMGGGEHSLLLLNTIVSSPPGLPNFRLDLSSPLESARSKVIDLGHNISSDDSGQFTNEFSISGIDPRLGSLGDHGGPTFTVALLPDSPAIDGGDSTGAPGVDQRGFVRPSGRGVDIGAFEYYAPPANTLDLTVAPNRDLLLTYSGVVGQTCRLLVSSNLVDWEGIQTNSVPRNGRVVYTIPVAQTVVRRFYQVVTP